MNRLFRTTAAIGSMLVAARCAPNATDDANQLSFDTPEQATAALVA